MLMIQNNLDPAVAQHPYELVTYGGNGSVFQNWAQYLLTMQLLSEMTDEQTLVLYSGHPLGLFPSSPDSPRVVLTNGMVIPENSTQHDLDRMNALGVTQYGQMTAGSFMHRAQGIVHGTTITLLNAGRMYLGTGDAGLTGKVYVTSGMGGMSGAQAKAAVIAGAVGVVAEINPAAIYKRHEQGWLDEVEGDLDRLVARIREARDKGEAVSLGYLGNIVDLWEKLVEEELTVHLGSDQTSLHNPFGGGYYPAGLSFSEARQLMDADPDAFQEAVYASLRRHVAAINTLCERGMYFWDYGNAFLVRAREAGADIEGADGGFRYPSTSRTSWAPSASTAASGLPVGLRVGQAGGPRHHRSHRRGGHRGPGRRRARRRAPADARQPALDPRGPALPHGGGLPGPHPLRRPRGAAPARRGLQRRHRRRHPVGAGRPGPRPPRRLRHRLALRETANIKDGSRFTADMAVHNFVGDAMRGATWVACTTAAAWAGAGSSTAASG